MTCGAKKWSGSHTGKKCGRHKRNKVSCDVWTMQNLFIIKNLKKLLKSLAYWEETRMEGRMGPILDNTEETNLGKEKGTSMENRESTNMEDCQREKVGHWEENVLGKSSKSD